MKYFMATWQAKALLVKAKNNIVNIISKKNKKLASFKDDNQRYTYYHECQIDFDEIKLGKINNKIEELESLPIIMVELSEEDVEMFRAFEINE